MPVYRFQAPNGRTFGLEGDSPPNEEELEAAFAALPPLAAGTQDQEALAQQYIAQQQAPVSQKLERLGSQGASTLGGLADIVEGGASGLGEVLGEASVAPEKPRTLQDLLSRAALGPLSSIPGVGPTLTRALPNLLQSGYEGATRVAYDLPNMLPSSLEDVVRGAAMGVPGGAQVLGALNLVPRTPSQAETRAAVAKQEEQQAVQGARVAPIAPEVFGKANLPVSEAAPFLIGAETLPGTLSNLITKTIPQLTKQTLRTAATIGTTPISSYYAARSAEPFLSGKKLSEAQAGVDTALAKEAAIQRGIIESNIKEGAATKQSLEGIVESRGAAAVKGREALAAQRELKAAESTLTPEIVRSQNSIFQAANLPVVILGQTAKEFPIFGEKLIKSIEKPLKASEEAYHAKYKSVEKSLPTIQPKLESKPLFDAASQAKGEFSEGFEALNKGEIKKIIEESSRATVTKSSVPQLVQNIYNTASPAAKADLVATYPELAQAGAAGRTIPKHTFSELQSRFRQVNQGVNHAVRNGNSNDARILLNIKAGIKESMENYASVSGPETLKLFEDANVAYSAHQNKFGLDRIQTLFKDDVIQNPEFVAKQLIEFDNPSQVAAVKAIVSKKEFIPVQAQFSKRFFSPNPDVAFDPSHFVKQFNKPGAREVVKEVFGKQGLDNFNRIYDASQSFAKIEDFQKTIDRLSSQSKSATESFSKARAGATEAEKVFADKNRLKADLKKTQEEALVANLPSLNGDLSAAYKELDRVKNYRDLRDWATRVSGLNILDVAIKSPAWGGLSKYLALQAAINDEASSED